MLTFDSFTGAAALAQLMKKKCRTTRTWEFRWKPVCASTEKELSNWLTEKPLKDGIARAFLARRQTFGVGQRGRIWRSPRGGVWISTAFLLNDGKESAGLLGLALAVTMAQRLERLDIPVQIKWPNDLLVEGRKLAGFLPKLIYRGGQIKLGRVGLGLNVCNQVPIGAISLAEIMRPRTCDSLFWASEVLLEVDRAIKLMGNMEYIRLEAERFLWTDEFKDPNTGRLLKVEGLTENGALKIRDGVNSEVWNRWD